jgi:hypothetical protein
MSCLNILHGNIDCQLYCNNFIIKYVHATMFDYQKAVYIVSIVS